MFDIEMNNLLKYKDNFTKAQKKAARNFLRSFGVPVMTQNDKHLLQLLVAFSGLKMRNVPKNIEPPKEMDIQEIPAVEKAVIRGSDESSQNG